MFFYLELNELLNISIGFNVIRKSINDFKSITNISLDKRYILEIDFSRFLDYHFYISNIIDLNEKKSYVKLSKIIRQRFNDLEYDQFDQLNRLIDNLIQRVKNFHYICYLNGIDSDIYRIIGRELNLPVLDKIFLTSMLNNHVGIDDIFNFYGYDYDKSENKMIIFYDMINYFNFWEILLKSCNILEESITHWMFDYFLKLKRILPLELISIPSILYYFNFSGNSMVMILHFFKTLFSVQNFMTILSNILIAVDNLDEIIESIKESEIKSSLLEIIKNPYYGFYVFSSTKRHIDLFEELTYANLFEIFHLQLPFELIINDLDKINFLIDNKLFLKNNFIKKEVMIEISLETYSFLNKKIGFEIETSNEFYYLLLNREIKLAELFAEKILRAHFNCLKDTLLIPKRNVNYPRDTLLISERNVNYLKDTLLIPERNINRDLITEILDVKSLNFKDKKNHINLWLNLFDRLDLSIDLLSFCQKDDSLSVKILIDHLTLKQIKSKYLSLAKIILDTFDHEVLQYFVDKGFKLEKYYKILLEYSDNDFRNILSKIKK